eukprot:8342930-Lingulodinium_polyedra.AAC.1
MADNLSSSGSASVAGSSPVHGSPGPKRLSRRVANKALTTIEQNFCEDRLPATAGQGHGGLESRPPDADHSGGGDPPEEN